MHIVRALYSNRVSEYLAHYTDSSLGDIDQDRRSHKHPWKIFTAYSSGGAWAAGTDERGRRLGRQIEWVDINRRGGWGGGVGSPLFPGRELEAGALEVAGRGSMGWILGAGFDVY